MSLIILATEKHYSIQEISELWGLSVPTVRELLRNEPGVLKIDRPAKKGKRRYTTLRVPMSVMERVWLRQSKAA